MVDAVGTGLALLAAALMLFALVSMNAGDFAIAGLSFLGASLAIYFRETRV